MAQKFRDHCCAQKLQKAVERRNKRKSLYTRHCILEPITPLQKKKKIVKCLCWKSKLKSLLAAISIANYHCLIALEYYTCRVALLIFTHITIQVSNAKWPISSSLWIYLNDSKVLAFISIFHTGSYGTTYRKAKEDFSTKLWQLVTFIDHKTK